MILKSILLKSNCYQKGRLSSAFDLVEQVNERKSHKSRETDAEEGDQQLPVPLIEAS